MRIALWAGAAAALAAGILAALAVGADAPDSPAGAQADGPVIALGEDWDSYPTAEVSGRLIERDGCLLLGASVVFWPYETTWDQERGAVEFGGDFASSEAARIGEEFTGGGGFYSAANVEGLAALDAKALLRCLRRTGADGVVFAYPAG